MGEIWNRAIHGPIWARVALWAAATAFVTIAVVLDLGWWSFILRAGVLLFLAGLAAHALTTRIPADGVGRVALWIMAVGVVALALLAIFIAAFDGEGSP
jgi:hypothetical protein